MILACRAPKLLNLLKSDKSEDLELPFDFNETFAYITYLYTDNLKAEKSILSKIMEIADTFGDVRLKKLCLQLQSPNLNVLVPDSTFRTDMAKAVGNERFSDVNLIIGEITIPAHRAVLAQYEYFRAMFCGSVRLWESSSKNVVIQGVEGTVFIHIIKYAYTSEIEEINPEVIIELFQATSQVRWKEIFRLSMFY